MTQIQVRPVPPESAKDYWRHVRHYLTPAIDRSGGRWLPEYVLANLVLGYQTLWVATMDEEIVGALTTEVMRYPERTNLAVHFLGGEQFDAWFPKLTAVVTAYAKSIGCESIECAARSGFWKWFKEDGFEREAVLYEKKL